MGKNAQLRKQSQLEQSAAERELIAIRARQAKVPVYQQARRLVMTIVLTLVLIYVGQVINQKLAHAANLTEVLK